MSIQKQTAAAAAVVENSNMMMMMNGGVKFLSVVNNDVGADAVAHLLQYVYSEKIPTLEEARGIFALFQQNKKTTSSDNNMVLWQRKKEMVTGVNGLYSTAIFRIIPFLEEEKEMICYVSGDKMTVLETFLTPTTTTTPKATAAADPTTGVAFLARINNSAEPSSSSSSSSDDDEQHTTITIAGGRVEAVTKLLSYSGKPVTLEQAQEMFLMFQKVDDWNEKKGWLLSKGVNSLFPVTVFYLLPDPSNQSEMICYWSHRDDDDNKEQTITILQTEVVEAEKKVFDLTGVNLLDATNNNNTAGALTLDVDTSTTGTSTVAAATADGIEGDVVTVTSKATTTSTKKRKKIRPKNRKSSISSTRSTSGRLPLNCD